MRPSLFSRRGFLLLAGATTCIRAADKDFWNLKPSSQWDLGEVYALMNNSPWARTARWLATKPPHPGSIRGGGIDIYGMSAEGPKAVITWESALPIRDALRTPPAPVFANRYVIGVDTIPRGDDYGNRLKDYAHLRCVGRNKWLLGAQGAYNLIRSSSVYEFSFPMATAPIGLNCEVIFDVDVGGWKIQSRFRTNDMLYRGRLAL